MTGADFDPRRRELTGASGRVTAAFDAFPAEAVVALAEEMGAAVRGGVDFGPQAKALYATDASNYRQVPLGVVTPRDLDDVVAAVGVCHKHRAPVLSRGGGTSLAGQTCNVAVVLDFSRHLDQVIEVDAARRLARVEPGCVLDVLRDTAEQHQLTFGPDPATHDHNTLGGMIGNDSCGVHSVMAGRTSDNVERLEVLTYDGLRMEVGATSERELHSLIAAGGRRGEIYRRLLELRDRYGHLIRRRFPKIPRRVSGFENLDALLPENGFNVARALTGTEGSCVTVLNATLKLVPSPPCRVLAVLSFDDVFAAADAVPRVLEYDPLACEGIDDLLLSYLKKKHPDRPGLDAFSDGCGWLLVEFGADHRDVAADRACALIKAFGGRGRLLREPGEQQQVWKIRESALGATAFVPGQPDTWPGWEDSAVHRDNLGPYLRELKGLFHRHGYEAAVYGHFGDGLIHCRVDFDLGSEAGIAEWRAFMRQAADLAVRFDGSLSGEHGDGQARAELLERMYGPELVQCFREFKAIWDPHNRMNPGKAIDPFPITSNLRVGPAGRPPDVSTVFAYPDDQGSFGRAAMRCVGVGKCRRDAPHDEVMCPSWQVTHDEKHSTRGRARLLFEMLRGETLTDGWRSREVEEALSLCLACKGCRRDCPVDVDMATYKAEFRYHHYRGRLRPRAAYSMGLVWWWARAASLAPGATNWMLHGPGVGPLARRIAGMAADADPPRLAGQSFRAWFRARRGAACGGRRVVLWPDTFNTYFRPQTAIAATELLERAGYNVVLPNIPLCCGRPLFDWGFLETAKRLWRRTLDALAPEIEAGTPIVGLEPACLSTFKDELPNLMADDDRAEPLSKAAIYFADLVDSASDRFPNFVQGGRILLHPHCNHHAVIGVEAELRVLERLGAKVQRPPSGCCGMAGSFGLAADTAAVGLAVGERVLLPAVRAADPDVAILADGFSCRTQIETRAERPTLHLAELLARRAGLYDGHSAGRL